MSTKTFNALGFPKRVFIVVVALLTILSTIFAAVNNAAASGSSAFTEYSVPFGDRTKAITLGPDGALWFAERAPEEDSGGSIGRLSTSGSFTEFPIPQYIGYSLYGAAVGDITTGPDGALWFTELHGNQVVRVSTAGQYTRYLIPTNEPYYDVEDIASGPDGALWFTMPDSNKIARITTLGSITKHSLPTANASPGDITAGPDGAMWFIESDKIGRITTSGSVTEYPLPANLRADSIVAGPDNALWFTDRDNNKIGRITTSGHITDYSIQTLDTRPSNITVGPDGALWFTQNNNRVGRISTAGIITEYSLPPASSATALDITAGPNNTLWVTQSFGNQIVKINLPLILSASSPTQNPVLSWVATSGASSYNIYRDSIKIDSTTDTTYTDNNAAEGTHDYYITSVENTTESDPSNSVRVVVDRTAPTLGTLTWIGDNPVATENDTNFRLYASDSGTSIVAGEYFIGADPGIGNGTPLTWIGMLQSPNFGADLAPGVYGIGIRGHDAAGNWSTITATHLVVSSN